MRSARAIAAAAGLLVLLLPATAGATAYVGRTPDGYVDYVAENGFYDPVFVSTFAAGTPSAVTYRFSYSDTSDQSMDLTSSDFVSGACVANQGTNTEATRVDCSTNGTIGITIETADDDDVVETWAMTSPLVPVSVYLGPGADYFGGGDAVETVDGGTGDDLFDGIGPNDAFNGGEGFDTLTMESSTTGVNVTLGKGGITSIEGLTGSDQADQLGGDGAENTIRGLGGDDTISAKDGRKDTIDCGPGNDTVTADGADQLTGCETVNVDDDADGVSRPTDCNDANASIRPGVADVPDNGVDEDCTGADAVNLDRDRDGFNRPVDCDDGNAAIHPGATDVPGDAIDQDCASGPEPFSLLNVLVKVDYRWLPRYSRISGLRISPAIAGSTIDVRCKGRGCPFRKRTRSVKTQATELNLGRWFRGARLRHGTKVEVRVTKPLTIGRVSIFRFRRGSPRRSELCLPPGAPAPRSCSAK